MWRRAITVVVVVVNDVKSLDPGRRLDLRPAPRVRPAAVRQRDGGVHALDGLLEQLHERSVVRQGAVSVLHHRMAGGGQRIVPVR